MGRYTDLLVPSKPPTPPASSSPAQEKPVSPPLTNPSTPTPNETAYRQTVPDEPRATVLPRYRDTMPPRNHATTIPKDADELLEAVRKSVKQVGKEPATQRLTLEEKRTLKAIEYTYGQQGILTSGNEIIRIATNYILQDYRQHGEQSILARVLKLLNS